MNHLTKFMHGIMSAGPLPEPPDQNSDDCSMPGGTTECASSATLPSGSASSWPSTSSSATSFSSSASSSESASSSSSSGMSVPHSSSPSVNPVPSEQAPWKKQKKTHGPPSPTLASSASPDICMKRIKRDLSEFFSDPPEGIFVLTRDADITKIDAVIVGPRDTPYQGGFFHFYLDFGKEYPWKPPSVKLMTTGYGKVRFNPNFYNCGKVCLSILGTWAGPQWTASQTISSLLCTIQSLMTDKPHMNEPGYAKIPITDRRVKNYNNIITHETLRVAVCDTLEGKTQCPPQLLKEVVGEEFLKNYDYYVKTANHFKNFDRIQFADFLNGCSGKYNFTEIHMRLKEIRVRISSSSSRPDGASAKNDGQVIGSSVSGVSQYSSLHRMLAGKAGVEVTKKDGTPIPGEDEIDLSVISDDEEIDSYEEDDDDDDDEFEMATESVKVAGDDTVESRATSN